MADSYIQLPSDSTGKKVQSWVNTVDGSAVHTQATTIVKNDGTEVDLHTLLTAIGSNTDGIEGFVDGIEALLTTLNGYVDGLEALVGTTNSTLTTVDGRVDGLEGLITTLNGYVDTLESLIGTTNTTLTTIDGRVDGLEALITTLNGYVDGLEALANTQYDEDTASTAGEKVTMAGVVRKDTGASMVGTDGDRTELQVDASGDLRVTDETAQSTLATMDSTLGTIDATLTTMQSDTNALQGAVYDEDTAHGTGHVGMFMLGVRNDAAAATLTSADGDYSAVAVDNKGRVLTDGSTKTQPTSDVAATTTSVTLQSAATGTGNGTVLSTDGMSAAMITVTGTFSGTITLEGTEDGTNYVSLMRRQVGATDTSTGGITATGNFVVNCATMTNIRARISAYTSGSITVTGHSSPVGHPGFIVPVGDISHDAVDANAPNKIGAKATSSISAQTSVATADRTNLFAGVDGVLLARNHTNLEDIVTATPVAITDGSSTSVLAAQGASIKSYITGVTIANSSASFVTVDLRDGTGGAVKWTFPVPATGGVTHKFDPPLPFSANTAVAADPSAAASTVTVSVIGFKSRV